MIIDARDIPDFISQTFNEASMLPVISVSQSKETI